MQVAPTSSKSLLASNFKSEPTEIHLHNIIQNMINTHTDTLIYINFKKKGNLQLLVYNPTASNYGSQCNKSKHVTCSNKNV